MRKLLVLAVVAAALLTSGAATAQGSFGVAPMDPSRVDPRDLIRHDKSETVSSSDPRDYRSLSDRDLQQKANQLAAQEQEIRAARQAVADETARRAKR
jgi:hypothetical protein